MSARVEDAPFRKRPYDNLSTTHETGETHFKGGYAKHQNKIKKKKKKGNNHSYGKGLSSDLGPSQFIGSEVCSKRNATLKFLQILPKLSFLQFSDE
ncbi:hypothetical protein POVWA1_061010 [Plasmodium ovale wallikeri]|uniref:Uncharacterized protein n=1 Tax=Plasmodium ovale wallikeri TaxID=864142 RepID=A0A1A9A286_PLAOA|nr:hypothetical protein POVWA1_061010 [Plasmodium ovale wallikeri]